LLRQGKAHILSYVPPELVESLNAEANVRLEKTQLLTTSFLGFNTKSAVLADAKVRQSLLFLLDQDYLINRFTRVLLCGAKALFHLHWKRKSGADTYRLIMR